MPPPPFKLIASDYETAETILRPGWDNNPNQIFYPAASTPKQLMATIRNPPEFMSAQITTCAFFDMKKRVHWDVPMFDIVAAEKWCAAHKLTCDQ